MSLIGRLRDRHAAATADEEWLDGAPEDTGAPGDTLDGGIGVPRGEGLPSVPLTASRAAAVRFQVSKPGYTFDQVESFVQQTQESLAALEDGLYQRDVALMSAREDTQALEERAATLQATIEVFRANGDPETTRDGDYVTEEQWEQMRADRDQAVQEVLRLTSEVEQLRAQLETAASEAATIGASEPPVDTDTQEMEILRVQVSELQAALYDSQQENETLRQAAATSATQEDEHDVEALRLELQDALTQRDEASREVEELRHYIETELTEWAANVAAAANAANTEPSPKHEADNQSPPSMLNNAPELS